MVKLQVRKPILDSLLSPDTSPDTKQPIINGLIHAQTNGKKSSTCVNTQDTTQSESPIPTNKLSTTTNESSTKITKPSGFIIDETFKVWKETEEKFLIDTRHQMDDFFKKYRNHSELWKTISEKLFHTLHCRVTQNQCMYKYNALKKNGKK